METLEYTLNIRSMRKSWEAAPDYELAPYVPPPSFDEIMRRTLVNPTVTANVARNNALLSRLLK